MDGKSLDIKQDKLKQLQSIIPEAFTEDKIDWEKLKAFLGDDINFHNERYNLNWAGKSDAFRVLQQRTSATLRPIPEESILPGHSELAHPDGVSESQPPASAEDFINDKTDNLFIEGENLEVLKVLQKSYFGKIKMIYIDPPYNTGNDSFIYPDKFSETKDEYLKRIGDKDEEGYLLKEGFFRKNSKDSGHYHSNWLSMMYPRLFIAKNLLKEEGVIFVSIDDNEVHNLRMIMNEIFGEENFIADIIWEKRYGRSNDAKLMASQIDHIIMYRKSDILKVLREPRDKKSDKIYSNPDNDPRGKWTSVSFVSQRTREQRPNLSYKIANPYTNEVIEHPNNSWKYSEDKYNDFLKDNRFYWGKDGNQKYPRIKRFLAELPEGMVPINLWKLQDVGSGETGTKEVEGFIGKDMFDHPKPSALVKRMLNICTRVDNEDIVLDFFAGSGTTAQAVLELNKEDGGNRKFILVQLPEAVDENSEAFKAGYKTIADICKERIRRVIQKMQQKVDSHPELVSGSESQTNLDLKQNENEKENENETSPPSQGGVDAQADGVVPLGFRVFKLAPSNFKHWRSDIIGSEDDLNQMIDLFGSQLKPEAKEFNMLYELILKSGLTLTDKIEKKNGWYSVAEGKLAVVLKEVNQNIIEEITKSKLESCIILDDLFANNDQLKTNTALQMKDADIELISI